MGSSCQVCRGLCESYQVVKKLFQKEQGCMHAFAFLSSMLISVYSCLDLSLLD